jgi:hypothetical protein
LSAKGIVRDRAGRDRNGLAIRIPRIRIERVAKQVAIGIVAASAAAKVLIRRRIVPGLPGNATAFGDVSERIVGERLRPDRTAIYAADASKIVVEVGASLIVTAVEWIGDSQLLKRTVCVSTSVSLCLSGAWRRWRDGDQDLCKVGIDPPVA